MGSESGSEDRGAVGDRMVALLPRLSTFARSLAGSRDAADDLVQATCEKALSGIDGWIPGTRLDSWMFRIMRNHWIDQARRPRIVTPMEEAEAASRAPGEDGRRTAEARLTLDEVRAAIEALPEEQRSVLVLTCVEDMTYRETAEILGVPVGTVMSRLARARRAIAERTGEAGPEEKPRGKSLGRLP